MLVLSGARQPGPGFGQASDCSFCESERPAPARFGTEGTPEPTVSLSSHPWEGLQSLKRKTLEPAGPQRRCFCGGQQPPWLPPLQKTILTKTGGLGRRQEETAPSTQRLRIFPALWTNIFQFPGFQIPVVSSGKRAPSPQGNGTSA